MRRVPDGACRRQSTGQVQGARRRRQRVPSSPRHAHDGAIACPRRRTPAYPGAGQFGRAAAVVLVRHNGSASLQNSAPSAKRPSISTRSQPLGMPVPELIPKSSDRLARRARIRAFSRVCCLPHAAARRCRGRGGGRRRVGRWAWQVGWAEARGPTWAARRWSAGRLYLVERCVSIGVRLGKDCQIAESRPWPP